MFRSDQLGLRCTVEPNCSDMSARLAGASATRDRALDTCEPSYVSGAARPFFCGPHPTRSCGVCGSIGALLSGRQGRDHVAAPESTSIGRRGPELRNTWQRRSSPLGEAEPRAMGHVIAPKPTSTGRRGPKLRNTWQRQSSTQQGGDTRGHVTCGRTRAHLSK
jgi:hypothetical protein